MPLKLEFKHILSRSVIQNDAVIDHLRSVLNTYVNKPDFSLFYIGITSSLTDRRYSHEREKPMFRLMCPIYEESHPRADIAFHELERDAINSLRGGIFNPRDRSKSMICGNGAGGSLPKDWLYVLLG